MNIQIRCGVRVAVSCFDFEDFPLDDFPDLCTYETFIQFLKKKGLDFDPTRHRLKCYNFGNVFTIMHSGHIEDILSLVRRCHELVHVKIESIEDQTDENVITDPRLFRHVSFQRRPQVTDQIFESSHPSRLSRAQREGRRARTASPVDYLPIEESISESEEHAKYRERDSYRQRDSLPFRPVSPERNSGPAPHTEYASFSDFLVNASLQHLYALANHRDQRSVVIAVVPPLSGQGRAKNIAHGDDYVLCTAGTTRNNHPIYFVLNRNWRGGVDKNFKASEQIPFAKIKELGAIFVGRFRKANEDHVRAFVSQFHIQPGNLNGLPGKEASPSNERDAGMDRQGDDITSGSLTH